MFEPKITKDAKPQINARRRIHPILPAAPGRPVRYEHEYRRQGSLALLAGLDVHTGQVFASTPLTTGIKPFMDLAGQVMTRPEYKDAPRVFVIVDNGSDHRGQTAVTRLARAHPNAIMIHTPVHASWLNQIEIFFSVIQMAAAARELYLRGHDLGLGPLDDSALIEVLRRERGTPAREDDPACPPRGNSSPGHGATRSPAE